MMMPLSKGNKDQESANKRVAAETSNQHKNEAAVFVPPPPPLPRQPPTEQKTACNACAAAASDNSRPPPPPYKTPNATGPVRRRAARHTAATNPDGTNEGEPLNVALKTRGVPCAAQPRPPPPLSLPPSDKG